ncbi:hypothetical protein AK830_g1686 [Neonectria ditissima]|uniref:HMG box domain-containing protein n=1 Tax=Neonectria ditissima TaxID=78410 RepID=A0A0P7BWC9_9HYPO|nr:hypothetical protein AK830_g1686 [Neonectria ditissima]
MNPPANTSHPRDAAAMGGEFLGYSHLRQRHTTPGYEGGFVSNEHSQYYPQKGREMLLTGYPAGQDAIGNAYGPLPAGQSYSIHAPYTPEASPPTPCPVTRSRVGVAKKLLQEKPLGVRGARVQKRSRDQKLASASLIISKSLSEIAKDMPHVPVADIETFVTRSAEQRLQETSRNKKAGQIKRPMNAFMLYRKAYQEVAKTQCARNNHQHVSKVCGAGWPMESDQVHEMFTEWARIERVNHQQAHPGYKFSPSKPRKGKRDGDTDPDSTVVSDMDDPDWAPGGLRRGFPRAGTRQVSRMSETPSLVFEPPVEAIGEQPALTYHEMYGYAAPENHRFLPYDQVEASSYDSHIRRYPSPTPEMKPAMNRHSSPAFEYPIPPMERDVGFFNNYYQELEVANAAVDTSFFADGLYDGLPRELSVGPPDVMWQSHLGGELDDGLPVYNGEISEHDAYLRGTQEDWKLEELDEASQFENWVIQAEQVPM